LKFLHKKGQTEDILADLIPSIVIIIIAVYLLGTFSSNHEIRIGDKLGEVKAQLESKIDVRTYLRMPVSADYTGECVNQRLTVADVISRIDLGKAEKGEDSCYELLKDMTMDFDVKYFQFENPKNWELVKSMSVSLEFPSKHLALYPLRLDEITGEEIIPIPLKNGQNVNVKVSTGWIRTDVPV